MTKKSSVTFITKRNKERDKHRAIDRRERQRNLAEIEYKAKKSKTGRVSEKQETKKGKRKRKYEKRDWEKRERNS